MTAFTALRIINRERIRTVEEKKRERKEKGILLTGKSRGTNKHLLTSSVCKMGLGLRETKAVYAG